MYEVDPLICPRCSAPMRALAVVGKPEEVRKTLLNLVNGGGRIRDRAGVPIEVRPERLQREGRRRSHRPGGAGSARAAREEGESILAGRFRAVQNRVGVLQQQLRGAAVAGIEGDTDAGCLFQDP